MRICVFDLETRKLAQELDPNGWDKMRRGEGGISALAIHDSQENWTFVYDDHEMGKIADHLESADVIVGFNSLGFDLPVVEGLLGRKLDLKGHIDLLVSVRQSLAELSIPQRKGENTLGAICSRTLGREKQEDGKFAPQLARDGEWGRLMRYCMDDVRLTRDLYHHILLEGGVISVNGTFVPINGPLSPPRVPQEDND